MAGNKVDIKAGLLFPFPFLVIGAGLFVAGVIGLTSSPYAGVLILISIVVLTAFEGTEINTQARTIREYYAFLFFKIGSRAHYKKLEGISIHSAKVSQRLHAPRTSKSSTFTHVEYRAYLKLDDGEKIMLFSHKDKTKTLTKARKLSESLSIPVADHAIAR
jgi:hypothetical protein